jgi:hypothetical protein
MGCLICEVKGIGGDVYEGLAWGIVELVTLLRPEDYE